MTTVTFMSKLLASLMRNYFSKRTSVTPLHTLFKLYDVPVGFVSSPLFEAEYCYISDRQRVAVAPYRMICLFRYMFIQTVRLLSELLASLMKYYFLKRPSGATLHTLSKLYDVLIGFVPPLFFWVCVLLYLLSPQGGCCSISDDVYLLTYLLDLIPSLLLEKGASNTHLPGSPVLCSSCCFCPTIHSTHKIAYTY